jgi:class 3 adenylate cyclase
MVNNSLDLKKWTGTKFATLCAAGSVCYGMVNFGVTLDFATLFYYIVNTLPILTLGTLLRRFESAADPELKNVDQPTDSAGSINRSRRVKGYILAIDIRGYTDLTARNSDEDVGEFTSRYLGMVNETILHYGGFVHKTSGDGHLISFGIMDVDPPSPAELVLSIVKAFDEIAVKAEAIAEETLIEKYVSIGAAIDFGEIDVRFVNHTSPGEGFDIFGQTIIRCARLEAHTKVIRENFFPQASLLIMSSFAAENLAEDAGFIRYQTLFKPVRDFPQIDWFLVKPYQDIHKISSTNGLAI